MKFLLTYKLFEKTSLLNIGVPYSVMQELQRNYSISDNAQWKLLKYKKDITPALNKKNNLVISICKDKIFILFSFNKEFYVETYQLTEDFGEIWTRIDRVKATLSEILTNIIRGCKSYELISGDWSHEFSTTRKIRKEELKFDDITKQFKIDFAENFTRIVKRLYGKKANIITDIIINHLASTKKNISEDKIREILFLNIDKAKEVNILKNKQKSKDPYKLYSDIIKSNSLTIFDEYLIRFEDEYSDKYKEYLNIPIMIERFTRDKILTAFMIYLYTNKLIEL